MKTSPFRESPTLIRAAKIPSLDGVRAVSFLIVFIAHAGLDRIVPGRFGVNIFFALSGYLITTLLIREQANNGTISLKLFYLRRALRIFPPMYAVLGATACLLWYTDRLHGVSIRGVCSQLFYYQNYYFGGGVLPGLGPLWSLAVEEHFYIFFPPLMLILISRVRDYARISGVLLAICGVVLCWRCCVVAFMPQGLRWARDASDTRCDSILFGCVLACLQQTALCRSNLLSKRQLERFILPVSILTLLLTFVVRDPVFRETLRYSLQGLALIPWLYYVVAYPETILGSLLNTPALRFLGLLSYSLYLIHGVVLVQMQNVIGNALLRGLVSFAISLSLAMVVRALIERPLEKLRSRLRNAVPLPSLPESQSVALLTG